MAKGKRDNPQFADNVADYRHTNVTRLNIPPAGLTSRGEIVKEKKLKFAYNPHLTPQLRFDASGNADRVFKLVEKAGKERLDPTETAILCEAFRNYEPWFEWAGKREQQWCVADPVALHIHERISTQAILRVAKREDVQRSLFADPEQGYREAVQFYKHPMDWTNRMILGDSLAVMASLARREALAGKVQMIYMDPPYGIRYASNFQPEVGRRDVKDRDDDLTREPEMIKAYRDTWTLGVHSYLSYLRDRLLLCKELLADTGSIFVQISDGNLHRVRTVMDEVFGADNYAGMISFSATTGQTTELLAQITDYLLWYAKDAGKVKFRQLQEMAPPIDDPRERYVCVETPNGEIIDLSVAQKTGKERIPEGVILKLDNLTSQTGSERSRRAFRAFGTDFVPGGSRGWSTSTEEGLPRLLRAGYLHKQGNTIWWKSYRKHGRLRPLTALWTDTRTNAFGDPKRFVVQTAAVVIERCLLMTTDPGDLVLDPTCGSGTTAYVAEQWGRRWTTIDVSRVALAIARQRLLTAKYDFYRLRPTSAGDVQRNPDGFWLSDPAGQIPGTCSFECKTVTRVTLRSIAQNQALDPIIEKWEPVLAEKLAVLNQVLNQTVTKELRAKLLAKLNDKHRREGKNAITEADQRRWKLPENEWKDWGVPFDIDLDWPKALQEALAEYRTACRQKMEEVNACIAARADQEELVDQPFVDKNKIRVSGPFTMEGIIPAEESIDNGGGGCPINGVLKDLETFADGDGPVQTEGQNAEAYLDRMIRLLREDGVRFPDNKVMKFSALEAMADGSTFHAKGTWANGDGERQVAVMFGPQYGPLVVSMVEDGIRLAARRGFDDLVFAAFSFDGAAQAIIQEDPDPNLRIHMAQIRPDVNMGDLLKTTVSSQLFTVSGSPRTHVEEEDGQYVVRMEGVDLYDPVTNSVRSTGAEKVAAWFLDSDYDGRCFCICQAFFPDKEAWEKLGKALRTTIDEDAFSKFSGTVSLPFPKGQHKRIAVKVIDPRGNEVLRVHKLGVTHD